MRKYMTVLASCLLAATLFAGCQPKEQPEMTQSPDWTEHVEVTDATEAKETTGATEMTEPTQIPTETEYRGIVVRTKYGNLYYQDQWEDFMRVVQTEEDAGVVVSFLAEFDGTSYPLFQLHIGQFEGDPVGQITDAQGVAHDVFVTMEEINIPSGLTEGEQNRLFAMQEEINFVMDNLE